MNETNTENVTLPTTVAELLHPLITLFNERIAGDSQLELTDSVPGLPLDFDEGEIALVEIELGAGPGDRIFQALAALLRITGRQRHLAGATARGTRVEPLRPASSLCAADTHGRGFWTARTHALADRGHR